MLTYSVGVAHPSHRQQIHIEGLSKPFNHDLITMGKPVKIGCKSDGISPGRENWHHILQ